MGTCCVKRSPLATTSRYSTDAVQATPRTSGAVSVHTGDLSAHVPLDLIKGQDALVNCAGHVADGETFVALIDRLVTAVDSLAAAEQPVCWFLAGAALLDLDPSGRRGVDLPKVESTYWPHRVNFERLGRSRLDWRLLCPGPMVDDPALGLDRLRISIDAVPVLVPEHAATAPAALVAPVFASLIPEMIVPYADAAALMLANLDRGNAMSRRRVAWRCLWVCADRRCNDSSDQVPCDTKALTAARLRPRPGIPDILTGSRVRLWLRRTPVRGQQGVWQPRTLSLAAPRDPWAGPV